VFIIRQAKIEDVPTLVKLAKMVHFINLPADRDIIYKKIARSQECFVRAAGGDVSRFHQPAAGSGSGITEFSKHGEFFMFVLEDTETGGCLGTSQIVAHMGGPGNPNFSLKLERREFFSTSLQTGTSHIVARLNADESGPTEIGGLILQPASRGHRLGRFISLIRFHMMGMHRSIFADRVIAEMMGPITMDGQSILWEFFGRRFIPLSYTEADRHCQISREFISALLPKEDIYLSLLPPEARDVVGKVGEETIPARRMLEKLGFAYTDTIDPFDGGPHLEAETDKIPVVRSTKPAELGAAATSAAVCTKHGFVSMLNTEGEFRAVETDFAIERNRVCLPKPVMAELGWEVGASVGVTVLPTERRKPEPAKPAAKPARGKKVKA
jgi:arginine N-succinyltransferase